MTLMNHELTFIQNELKKELDLDIRITIPGHTQRGGSP